METDIRALIGDTDPETLSAPEVLGVMVEHFHPRLSLACSFQREESVLVVTREATASKSENSNSTVKPSS